VIKQYDQGHELIVRRIFGYKYIGYRLPARLASTPKHLPGALGWLNERQ
jgi:hypothetical protein